MRLLTGNCEAALRFVAGRLWHQAAYRELSSPLVQGRGSHLTQELSMPPQLLFGGSVAFGFIAWTIVRYMWPYLRARTRAEALRPLLVLHGLRFVGLSFRYQASWRREGMGDARAVCGESRAYRYKD